MNVCCRPLLEKQTRNLNLGQNLYVLVLVIKRTLQWYKNNLEDTSLIQLKDMKLQKSANIQKVIIKIPQKPSSFTPTKLNRNKTTTKKWDNQSANLLLKEAITFLLVALILQIFVIEYHYITLLCLSTTPLLGFTGLNIIRRKEVLQKKRTWQLF